MKILFSTRATAFLLAVLLSTGALLAAEQKSPSREEALRTIEQARAIIADANLRSDPAVRDALTALEGDLQKRRETAWLYGGTEPQSAPTPGADLFADFFGDRSIRFADPFASLQRMRAMQSQMMQGALAGGTAQAPSLQSPRIELKEDGNELLVIATVLGLADGQAKVSVTDRQVTIAGERRIVREEKGPDGSTSRSESVSQYRQSVALPEEVDASKAVTKQEGERVEVRIPRRAAVGWSVQKGS